jgi:bacterioferritin-associated ferredoxin
VIVCHCRGTSDRDIRRAIRCGASNLGEVARVCGAASGCGGCAGTVLEIMASESDAGAERAALYLELAPAR